MKKLMQNSTFQTLAVIALIGGAIWYAKQHQLKMVRKAAGVSEYADKT